MSDALNGAIYGASLITELLRTLAVLGIAVPHR
jgi:hypothetical protein